jgi:hypothetical protein
VLLPCLFLAERALSVLGDLRVRAGQAARPPRSRRDCDRHSMLGSSRLSRAGCGQVQVPYR